MLDTPVLFLVFNRPEVTEKVLREISRAKPKRLYIAADGPRRDREDEDWQCQKTREVCLNINWDCEVRTLFRETNLGCQLAVSGAIDWFFENEAEGIILEDDCLPSQSFFRYCSELLDYYRDDSEIMCVSGNNFQRHSLRSKDSYYFSRYPHCWGWATWRSAWKSYDPSMDNWESKRNVEVISQWSDSTYEFCKYWENSFDAAINGEVDSWSYRWLYSCWMAQGLTCLPRENLVKNIGFSETATHTNQIEGWYSRLSKNELEFPLKHPRLKRRNIKADGFTDREVYGIGVRARKRRKYLKSLNTLMLIFVSMLALLGSLLSSLPGRRFDLYGRCLGAKILYKTRKIDDILINPVSSVRYFEFDFTSRFLPVGSSFNLLDVSSPYLFGFWLVSRSNVNYSYINPDSNEFNRIACLFKYVNPVGKYQTAAEDATSLPYKDGQYDCVVSISVIEHISGNNDSMAISEMWRVLNSGGRMILTFPVKQFYQEEYRDQNVYSLPTTEKKNGQYFFQRYYDESAIVERLLKYMPGYKIEAKEIYGEIEEGFFQNYERRWISYGLKETVKDPWLMAVKMKGFSNICELPGMGVMCMVIIKTSLHGNTYSI